MDHCQPINLQIESFHYLSLTLMVRACSETREALEKVSSSTKTAFLRRSFWRESRLDAISVMFSNDPFHLSSLLPPICSDDLTPPGPGEFNLTIAQDDQETKKKTKSKDYLGFLLLTELRLKAHSSSNKIGVQAHLSFYIIHHSA